MGSQELDIAIIGAGISGIAAAKFYLDIHPNCKLLIFEKDDSVGGVWNSRRVFDTFYTQTPFGVWEFSDMPMTRPPEEDIYEDAFKAKYTSQYLETYIDRHVWMGQTLRDRIVFNIDVRRLTKENNVWSISGTSSSGETKTFMSPKIVIASGLTSVPNMPTLPGQEHFENPIIHLKDFGQSNILASTSIKKITVLGAAKSASDLVYDSVKAGKTVTWIIRAKGTGPGFFLSPEGSVSLRTIHLIATSRIISTLSPSLLNPDSWWNRILQRSKMGRKQMAKFWATVDKSVFDAPNFDDRGAEAKERGFDKLKPHTPVFWANQGAGVINRPNFWDIIAQNVQVYHADVDELRSGVICLDNGHEVPSDAILCGTGWVPSLSFFDRTLLAELGLPQPIGDLPAEKARMWDSLEKDADQTVLDRFPILANPPEHYHTPVTHTPYRLYSGIAPLSDTSVAFVGHVLTANHFRVAEYQAIWATAYLDGKVKLPPLEQRQKEVALFVAWCRRRYADNLFRVVASTFAVTPTERIKTALIDEARTTKRFQSSLDAIRVIYREFGLMGLYHGYAGTTLKQAGATAFRMGTYNILKDFEKSRDITQSTVTNFANGAVAGTVTTYATQPFDTIKTRSQSAKGASTVDAFRSIIADGGVRGFWRGTTMRLGRTVFSGGILFTVYEHAVALLNPVTK
ncbi:MAG: hypothetical protein Q9201_003729 [Fulgogasparrea decipioides]